MHNPPHPGEILKELCLTPLGLTITETAEALGIARKKLSAIIHGKAPITPEIAVRLSIAFETTSESWLKQQTQFDLWQAEQKLIQNYSKPLEKKMGKGFLIDFRLFGHSQWYFILLFHNLFLLLS